jgi:hypothetical protein
MSYRVITLEQFDDWKYFLSLLPKEKQDVYYSPEYYSLYETMGVGKAMCFILEENGESILYPFLLNQINKLGYKFDKNYFDIQGAYGYNGPISNTTNQELLNKFSDAFCDFCKVSNIVAEFTRFNPLLTNQNWLKHISPIKINDVINVDLTISKEDIWFNSHRKSVRQIITRCSKKGFEAKLMLIDDASEKDLHEFISIYYSTLERNAAEKFYYFNKDYIYNIRQKLPRNVLLAIIYFEDKPVATSINPFMAENAYGFIGGSLTEFRKESPFTYMLHKVIMKLKDLGVSNYLLGGGIEKGDNIYNYKLSLAKNGVKDFYIGKKIHNNDIYENLVNQWKHKFPESYLNHKNKVLGYREI